MESAGEVVLAYAAEQVGVLREGEAAVRSDAPDAVHRSRVAARRLRSTLRTYSAVFRRGPVSGLRDELRWFGEELGAPRDAEVLRDLLRRESRGCPNTDLPLPWGEPGKDRGSDSGSVVPIGFAPTGRGHVASRARWVPPLWRAAAPLASATFSATSD